MKSELFLLNEILKNNHFFQSKIENGELKICYNFNLALKIKNVSIIYVVSSKVQIIFKSV